MGTQIHPTAIIESGAELGEGVEVGAYAIIGLNVRIGDSTVVHHATSKDLPSWVMKISLPLLIGQRPTTV